MFCPSCGFQNSPNASFCGKCGASLVQARVPDPPVVHQPQPTYSVAQQPTAAQAPPPRSYSYSQTRSYGTRSGSVLGWILLLIAAAGLVGCFLTLDKTGEPMTVLKVIEESKSILVFPTGFGLMLIGGLLLGLGSRPRGLWLTLGGLGAGATVAGGLVLLDGAGWRVDDMGIGTYLLLGAAAVGLLVVLVESMFSPE